MKIKLEDGREAEIGAGDLFDLPAGHDAWVVGSEPCVTIDHSPDAARYATGYTAPVTGEPDQNLDLVREGYAAFNTKDLPGLSALLSPNVVQHVPGASVVAGEYQGLEAVLGYYGKLAELTDGSFRADLIDVHGDSAGHVNALHQITATRTGVTRVSRGSILFTFVDGRATDLLELHGDLAGDDAFLSKNTSLLEHDRVPRRQRRIGHRVGARQRTGRQSLDAAADRRFARRVALLRADAVVLT